MMFWYDHDMSGWGYAGMAIGMVLFWALLIVAIIALIRSGIGNAPPREAEQLCGTVRPPRRSPGRR